MEKKIYSLLAVCIYLATQAQVGVNTSNPQAIFHIDGSKDNAATGVPTISQQANDMVVTSVGNLGIGTTAPSQKLEIQTGGTAASPITGFKLMDGTQSDGFTLESDADGVGSWKPVTVEYYTVNPIGKGSYVLPSNTSVTQYTGVAITLPPGKWILSLVIPIKTAASLAYTPGSQFSRLRLKDTTTDTAVDTFSADAIRPRLVSGSIANAQDLGFMAGSLGVNNTTAGSKTYYLHADNFFSTGGRKQLEFIFDNWNETSISYMRIK